MTSLSPDSFILVTRSRRRVSTYGPFLRLLLIVSTPVRGLVGLATTDDHVVRSLLRVTRLVALRRLAPRRHRRTAGGVVLALAAAMRVIDRVHDRTTNGRTDATPALAASLADNDVGVFGIADLADRCTAGEEHAAHLGGRHAQDCVLALLAHELDGGACGTGDCCALARLELDSVDQRTDRNLGQRHCVARLDVDVLLAGDDDVADLKALRGQDVGLCAISIVEKSDAGGAVRIVLDRSDLGRDVVLLALEVDDTVTTLVAAALVTGGDAAIVVASCLLRQRREERLLGLGGGNLLVVIYRLEAPACARGL
jgi:hypothetical protein